MNGGLFAAASTDARATEWVTAANMGTTGTADQESAAMSHPIPNEAVDLWVELEYSPLRTGGDGNIDTWARIVGLADVLTDTNKQNPAERFTRTTRHGATPFNRHMVIPINVIQNERLATNAADRVTVHLRAAGTVANTQWQITGIRSRLRFRT